VVAGLRGINLGNAFDARPGWDVHPEHLDAIAAAGFTGVRLPVLWPEPVGEAFLERVAAVVELAWERELPVALTAHHEPDPARLAELWRTIADRFAGAEELSFELLNEPKVAHWDARFRELLAAVRDIDPLRPVVMGGTDMSSVPGLLALDPPRDEHLIATFHYYEPFRFTHQGAPWEAGSEAWLGTTWGTDADHEAVTADLERAAAWARERGVPLFAGEFGSFEVADRASRVRWTTWVRRELDRLAIPWAYWDFATDFGAYDRERGVWRDDLLAALTV
jgi:endoglucanase